ncbi:MFS transporter [Polymorphospora sp. A560]
MKTAARVPAQRTPDRRYGPLLGLVIGHAVSLTGNMLTIIALPLYVLAETGSAAATGLVGAFATAPMVIGGAFGGVLVDRIGYRRASVAADLVSGVTIAAVPLLDRTVGLPFWALLALVFATGLLDTPGHTARIALLPEAAAAAGMPVERAVAMLEATSRGARLVGAPVAGLLVAAFGALTVLAIDAVTFAVSAAVVAVLVPRGLRPATEPAADAGPGADARPAGYWREFTDGVRFLLREPLLRLIVLMVLFTNLLDAAKSTVLLPVVADRELGGATAFGLLVGAMGGGALAGSLVFGAIGHRLPRRPTYVVAFLIAGAPPFLALAAGLPLPALVTVTVVAGFAAGAINPMIGTIELERVPAGMRARVYGVIGAGCWAAMPVGSVGAGLAVNAFGTTATLVVAGCCYLLLSLTPLLGGPWRDMSRPAPARPAPVPEHVS